MKIGIVPMSAKPFHAGHNSLIKFAAGIELLDSLEQQGFIQQQNDIVNVYVSYSSRDVKKRTKGGVKYEEPIPGKSPVFGADMAYIWENILTKENLGYSSTNVEIISPRKSGSNSPVTAGFNLANLFKEAYNANSDTWFDPITNTTFKTNETYIKFYCGEDDLNRYSESLMSRLYDNLWYEKRIQVVAIPRVVEISGTQMRNYLCNGDIESLKEMFPEELSDHHKNEIASILTRSVACGFPSSKEANESLIKNYINLYLL